MTSFAVSTISCQYFWGYCKYHGSTASTIGVLLSVVVVCVVVFGSTWSECCSISIDIIFCFFSDYRYNFEVQLFYIANLWKKLCEIEFSEILEFNFDHLEDSVDLINRFFEIRIFDCVGGHKRHIVHKHVVEIENFENKPKKC